MICPRPAMRMPRFADWGILSCAAWMLSLCTAAIFSQAAERADLSLPPPDAGQSFQLSHGGTKVAEVLAHYSSALQFENAGKLREALTHYLAVLEVDPANSALALHTAELAYNFQGRPQAIALLEKAIASRPDEPAPYLNLARFALTYAADDPFEKERADLVLETALKRFPKIPDVYAFATLTRLTQGNREAAVKILEQAAKQDISDPFYWLAIGRTAQQVWPLGQAEMREEHTAKVNPFFQSALRHAAAGKKGESTRLEVAQYYLLTNQLDQARTLCEEIATQTGSLHARKLLHRLYDAAGEKDKSLATLEKIVEDEPGDVEQRKLLAAAYEAREEFAKAVPHLEAAIQTGGGEAEEYQALCELLLRSQLYERAIQLSDRCVKLFPDQAMFYVNAALAQRSLQRWEKAIQSFREAATLAEAGQSELINHRFYFQYGLTLERGGQPDEAGRMFEKSITLTPKDSLEDAANTMNYLGYMWLELDRHLDKAGELIRKANDLQPDNAAYVDSLGWWHFKKGDHPNALKELQRAFALIKEPQPDDAEIIEHIAQVYLKMDDRAKAREYFEKARALQPPDPRVKERIEKGLQQAAQP